MELYVGPKTDRIRLDTSEEFQVTVTYSFVDFLDPFKQKSDFSKTVVIPATPNNVKQLNLQLPASGIASFGVDQSLITPMVVYSKGRLLLSGSLKVLTINYTGADATSIEIALFGNRFSVIAAMGNKTIAHPDMAWGDYAHPTTIDHVVDNAAEDISFYQGVELAMPYTDPTLPFQIQGYRYPMIDFGLNNGVTWNLSEFRPYPYLREMVERMIWSNGYTLDPDNFFSKAENIDIATQAIWYNSAVENISENEAYDQVTANSIVTSNAAFVQNSNAGNFVSDFSFKVSTDPVATTTQTGVFGIS